MAVLGHEAARVFTPPLRELTPETSLGWRFIDFCREILGAPQDPWQEWLSIHALELRPDGRLRFRTILLLVARQNGKSEWAKMLVLWLLFTGRARLAVGTAQDLDIARRLWDSAARWAERVPDLAEMLDGKPRRANGQESLRLVTGAEYIIKATTEDAARGIQGCDLLLLDELRTHHDTGPWSALSKVTMAVPGALTVALSNAGDDKSVVLNMVQAAALSGRDDSIGIFEWSAPDGCDLEDREAWAAANPSLGRGRLTEHALENALALDPPAVFRTECLCQRVEAIDTAIDTDAWKASRDVAGSLGIRAGETPEAFAERRKSLRLAACVDVAPDGAHVTLAIAALESDGRVRVEVAAAWKSTQEARAQLPAVLKALKPAVTAWFPSGPAAALAPTLRPLAKEAGELRGAKVAEACMGFADLVRARRVLHPGDPLLDAHVGAASRLHSGDGWRFTRAGSGHVDAAYAAAGAAYMAITTHKPPRKVVVL